VKWTSRVGEKTWLVDAGSQLIKFWLEVGNKEQARRFEARIEDPLRQWKLSPTDLESRRRWHDYSRARDHMLDITDTAYAPWYIVRSDNKRRARLNCIAHLLSLIPYDKVPRTQVAVPLGCGDHQHPPSRCCGLPAACPPCRQQARASGHRVCAAVKKCQPPVPSTGKAKAKQVKQAEIITANEDGVAGGEKWQRRWWMSLSKNA